MANTINGMAVDEVRDKLKNLVSAEDWTIQDKTGYPYPSTGRLTPCTASGKRSGA